MQATGRRAGRAASSPGDAPPRKLSPRGERRDAEPVGDRLAEIAERGARRRARAGRTAGPKASSGTRSRVWSVPGVVGSLPWSAVMNATSSGAQRRFQLGQPRVQLDERAREPGGVVAVAVDHVEVDQVDEQQAAVQRGERLQRQAQAVAVALAVERLRSGRARRRCPRSCRRRPPSSPAPRSDRAASARAARARSRAGCRCAETRPAAPTNGRAMTRPMWWRSAIARAASQIRYSSGSGTISSCAAICSTESADV